MANKNIKELTYRGKPINFINGKRVKQVMYKGIIYENFEQLLSVTNLAIDGSVMSFDSVEKATSYDILIDDQLVDTIKVLQAPQNLNVDGTTISWDAVEHATSYGVIIDTVDFGVVNTTSVDLSTVAAWSGLADGNHTVYIKAKAENFVDSDSSAIAIQKQTTSGTVTLTAQCSDEPIFASTKTVNFTHVDGTSSTYEISVDVSKPVRVAKIMQGNQILSQPITISKVTKYEVTGSFTDLPDYPDILIDDVPANKSGLINKNINMVLWVYTDA